MSLFMESKVLMHCFGDIDSGCAHVFTEKL